MAYKITQKGLSRIARHLEAVLQDQFGDDMSDGVMNRSDALKFQWAERKMLERLRSGMMTNFDLEFYLHELKESTRFPSTKLMDAHNRALKWRKIEVMDMFPTEVLAALKNKLKVR
jgi:hypothetical protein